MARTFCIFVFLIIIDISTQVQHEDDTKNFPSTTQNVLIENSNGKPRIFYDYQTRIIAYKDLIESRCLLEFLKNSDTVRQHNLTFNGSLNNYYVSQNHLSKQQIWAIGGSRVVEFCRGFPTYLIQEAKTARHQHSNELDTQEDIQFEHKLRKRETKHFFVGRIRGQTQSQYLNFGKSNDAGKAEAESSYGNSRAVVTGSSGMGQAQSQSSPVGCEDCLGGQPVEPSAQYRPSAPTGSNYPGQVIQQGLPGHGILQGLPGQGIQQGLPGQGIHQGLPGQGIQQGLPGQGIHQGLPGQGIHQGLPGHGTQQGLPGQGIQQGLPGQGIQQGLPGQGIHQGLPGHGTQQGLPGQGIQQGLPGQGIQQGLPGQGIHQGLPSQGIQQGLPGQGIQQGLPGQGIHQGLPGQGIQQGLPGQGIHQGLPGQGIQQGLPGQGIHQGLPGQGTQQGQPGQGIQQGPGTYPQGPIISNTRQPGTIGYPGSITQPGIPGADGSGTRYPGTSIPGSITSTQPGYPGSQIYQPGISTTQPNYPGSQTYLPGTTTGHPGSQIYQPGTPGSIQLPGGDTSQIGQRYPGQPGTVYPITPGLQIGSQQGHPGQQPGIPNKYQIPPGHHRPDQSTGTTGSGNRFTGRFTGGYNAQTGQTGTFSGEFSGKYDTHQYGISPGHPGISTDGPSAGYTYEPSRVTIPSDQIRYPIGGQPGTSGQGYPIGGQPGTSGQGYPIGGQPGTSGQGYPIGGQPGTSGQGYPIGGQPGTSGQGYPTGGQPGTSGQGYPTGGQPGTSGQGYPIGGQPGTSGQGYPTGGQPGTSGQGYPIGGQPGTSGQGYPTGAQPGTSGQGYPIGGQPGTSAQGYPIGGQPGTSGQGYPIGGQPGTAGQGYPIGGQPGTSGQGYPIGGQPGTSGQGYPIGGQPGISGQGYLTGAQPGTSGQGYPIGGQPGTSGQGYPIGGQPGTSGQGYPIGGQPGTSGQGYPTGGQPGTSGQGYPISGQPGTSGQGYPIGGQPGTSGQGYPSNVDTFGRPNLGQGGYYDQYGNYVTTGIEGSDDSDSQVQTSVQQTHNETQASASAQGKHQGGTAQSQVSGTYSGSGSFSASAGSDDGKRGALTQVSGGKEGAQSSAQGRGGVGQSQAQVQLNSETGDTLSTAQSGGYNHDSQTQVQASGTGGMADAQANGPGSTSSQAQIGFTPYDENEVDDQTNHFKGGGMASAQSGTYAGQTQSQIQGKFVHGIRYTGAAQAGSGSQQTVASARNQSRPFGLSGSFPKFKPLSFSSGTQAQKLQSSQANQNFQLSQSQPQMSSEPIQPQPQAMAQQGSPPTHMEHTKKFVAPLGNTRHTYEQTTKIEEEYSTMPSIRADEEEYEDDYDEYETDEEHTENPSAKNIISQRGKSQEQHIVLGPLEKLDATVFQSEGDMPPDGTILQPGQPIPGSPGYQIPQGFRGRVKSIASGSKTYTTGQNSQAQSVSLSPGSGRIMYKRPTYTVGSKSHYVDGQYGYGAGYTYQPVQYQVRSGSSTPNFVSHTKAEQGRRNLETGKKIPSVYYSQSSSCGIFTNSCVFNGSGRICFPKPKTNPDGSLMGC